MTSRLLSARSARSSRTARSTAEESYENSRSDTPSSNRDQDQQGYNSKRFLFELRKAFDEADVDEKGWLSFDEWMNSSIRKFIQDGNMNDDQFEKYFRRIDADCDMKIMWQELVVYLIQEITTRDLHIDNETTRLITKVNTIPPPKWQMHRDMIRRVINCKRTAEYVTLSSDSIRFWKPSDLTFKVAITDPGYFSDFLILENPFIMVVATTQRRLLFYELEMFTLLPVEISASPSTRMIKNMNLIDSQNALKSLDSSKLPMFNVPNAICPATFSNEDLSNTVYFFVGDDQGIIEVFKLCTPQRRKGTDYIVERVARKNMHDDAINQVSPIDSMLCYASCSSDHTVKFWQFDNTFVVLRTFTDTIPINGFLFSTPQKVLVSYGASRDAYVWSVSPPRKMYKLGDHYNLIEYVTDFVTTSKEKYILTMTNRKEFRIWDSNNYRALHEWSDPTLQRPENHYSCSMFDYERHALITCSSYPSKWAEDFTTNVSQFEMLTHNYNIVGCFYAPAFDQILTVDSISTFKLWDYDNGKLASEHKVPWLKESSQVSSSCLDTSSRKLITSTFKGDITLYNYNSGQEITKFSTGSTILISLIYCTNINKRDFLIVCRWDKTIMAYSETSSCQYELFRTFKAHKSDITAVTSSMFGLVSGGANGEIFSWSMDTTTPQAIGKIPTQEASVECIICTGYNLIVGDSKGFISVFLLPRLTLLLHIDAHGINRPYSLTTMCLDQENYILYTADTFGYVKKWNITLGVTVTLEPVFIRRCHNDEILSIILIRNGKTLLTSSNDRTVRVWRSEDFGYYGFLYNENNWGNLDDESSIKPSPFEIENQHFEDPAEKQQVNRPRLRKNNPLIQGSILHINIKDSNKNITCNEEKKEPESFDFSKFSETVEDFMTEIEKEQNQPPVEEKPKNEITSGTFAITQPLVQLQTTTRPIDLIHQFDNLYANLTNTKPIQQPAATSRLSGMQIKKPILQNQIKTSRSRANSTFANRLPLTLQFV